MLTVDFGWVEIRQLNFVGSGPKFTKSFSSNAGRTAVDNITLFPLVDVLIRCGDIRDQSLKLSKVVLNFEYFWPSQVLGVLAQKSCTQILMPALRHVM